MGGSKLKRRSESGERKPCTMLTLAVVGATLALAFAIGWQVKPSSERFQVKRLVALDSFAVPEWARVENRVDIVDFETFKKIHHMQKPLIVENSSMMEWAALSQWTPESLCAATSVFKGVQRTSNKSKLFIYEDNSRLIRQAELPFVSPANVEKTALSCHEFFGADRPVYMSTPFDAEEFQAIASDVEPRGFMEFDFVDEEQKSSQRPTAHISVSHVGTVTGMHYDLSNNIFAQVHGCKRFILAPPGAWRKTFQFPFFHPSDRQSQLETMSELPHDLEPIEVIVADLAPGQFLFLPAYYFHRVASYPCDGKNVSISLNAWTASREQLIAGQTKMALPRYFLDTVDLKTDPTFFLSSAVLYIRHVVNGVARDNLNAFIIDSVVRQRYGGQHSHFEGFQCAAERPECSRDLETFRSKHAVFVEQLLQRAEKMVQLFKRDDSVSPDARELMLADWIERVATLVVGDDVLKVCSFLSKCVSS